jgi:hypothetical protein
VKKKRIEKPIRLPFGLVVVRELTQVAAGQGPTEKLTAGMLC